MYLLCTANMYHTLRRKIKCPSPSFPSPRPLSPDLTFCSPPSGDRIVPGCNQCQRRGKVHLCRLEHDDPAGLGLAFGAGPLPGSTGAASGSTAPSGGIRLATSTGELSACLAETPADPNRPQSTPPSPRPFRRSVSASSISSESSRTLCLKRGRSARMEVHSTLSLRT